MIYGNYASPEGLLPLLRIAQAHAREATRGDLEKCAARGFRRRVKMRCPAMVLKKWEVQPGKKWRFTMGK